MREHLAKKHMRTGDYLDYGVEFYRQHLKTLLIFTAVFHVPVNFLISYLIGPSVLWEELLEAAEYGLTYDFVFRIYGGAALQSLYMSTFYYVLLLGIIYFTYHRIVWDKAYPVRFCLKQGLQRFGWVIRAVNCASAFFLSAGRGWPCSPQQLGTRGCCTAVCAVPFMCGYIRYDTDLFYSACIQKV